MADDAAPSAIAALMLVESLMLALLEAGLVTQDEIAETIEDVVASQRAIASDSSDPAVLRAAERKVYRIADRLEGALPRRRRRR